MWGLPITASDWSDLINRFGVATVALASIWWFIVFRYWPWYTKEYIPNKQKTEQRRDEIEERRMQQAREIELATQKSIIELIDAVKQTSRDNLAGLEKTTIAIANSVSTRITSAEDTLKDEFERLSEKVDTLSGLFSEVIREESQEGARALGKLETEVKQGMNLIHVDMVDLKSQVMQSRMNSLAPQPPLLPKEAT